MLGYTWWVTSHEVYNRVYRLTRDVLFASTPLYIREEPQLVHACSHEMYTPAFIEQVVLCALAEVIMSKVKHVLYMGNSTSDNHSTLNQAYCSYILI